MEGDSSLRIATSAGRWVLVACVLGTGLASIDASVVNIALPDIASSLHVGFSALQWTVTAYTVTLASLILLGGSLGDRFGRRRLFVIGIAWFAIASVLCALAPNAVVLIVARALQGVGGALFTPASLAIIQASFVPADRARAIGIWSGFYGTSTAVAPFLGGWLIQAGGWRWIFLINPPLAAAVTAITLRHMPETRDAGAARHLDVLGSVLGVIGLGGVTAGIIAAGNHSFASVAVLGPLAAGVLALLLFGYAEKRGRDPMLPMSLFASRQFSAANAVTLLLYASIGAALLLLVVELQTVSGFSPLAAGASVLPLTVATLLLSERFGALAQRIGPRLPMTVGPLVSAAGLALLTRLDERSDYWRDVLPAMFVFGLGLACFAAPLTATVLGAAPASRAGVASGVNNAVARAAGLLAVAVIPVVAGIDDAAGMESFLDSFRVAIWICVALMAGGGLLAAVTIRNPAPAPPGEVAAAPVRVPACVVGPGCDPPPAIRHDVPAAAR